MDADVFAPGARVTGKITAPGYEHVALEMMIERMEPERLFSYRWHPYAVEPGVDYSAEPGVDYSAEPSTLVEFVLAGRGRRHRAQRHGVRVRQDSDNAP